MLRRAIAFFLSTMLSTCALAFIDPCILQLPLAAHSPRASGPQDIIAFRPGALLSHFASWMGRGVVSKVSQEAADRIVVDIVLNALPMEFPGYREISLFYWHDDTLGQVGPLAPGAYNVRISARRYLEEPGSFQSVCSPQETTLLINAESGPVSVAPVIEYYNGALDHYFMTQDPIEIERLDAGFHRGWERTGHTFAAYLPDASDARGRSVCRFYGLPSAGFDTHLFSASVEECRAVDVLDPYDIVWIPETRNAFEITLPDLPTGACAPGTIPVYRLWNNRADSNHRYTTNAAIKRQMVARGYVPESFGPDNVVMCAPTR